MFMSVYFMLLTVILDQYDLTRLLGQSQNVILFVILVDLVIRSKVFTNRSTERRHRPSHRRHPPGTLVHRPPEKREPELVSLFPALV